MSENASSSNHRKVQPDASERYHKNREAALQRLQAKAQPTTNATQAEQEKLIEARKRRKTTMDLTYCEFNLSTMQDSKGGFMAEQPKENPTSTESTTNLKFNDYDMPFADATLNCEKCKASIGIDSNYYKYYNVVVCKGCISAFPEEYSLLTKTECREDYLLTESELRDSNVLPHWSKSNPHKSTYSNMLLYLRKQVEAFAWVKWGSAELLDKEFEKREAEKMQRKHKKFKQKLKGKSSDTCLMQIHESKTMR